ncbi:MAG TPA: hypothetical protein VF773_13955 [Verrucomicrobiae bacterium]
MFTSEAPAKDRPAPALERRWFLSWLMPLVWLALVGASLIYGGGENITLAAALLPAILLHQVTGLMDGMGNNFALPILSGLPIVVLVGYALDRLRVRPKMFYVSVGIGVLVAYLITAILFYNEASRSGFNRAYSLFDFDQPDRRIAWQLLCAAMGFYFSVPIVLLWRAAQAVRNSQRTQDR